MIGLTLRQQAFQFATDRGWSSESAQTVAELAVEISESNLPIFGKDFKQVMREALRSEHD